MDDITDALASSFQVTKSSNNIYSPHPRQHCYKQKSVRGLDQDTRRQRYIELQKQKRIDYKSHARRLALDEWSEDEEEKEKCTEEENEMEVEAMKHVKPPRKYKDQLMLSEWLVEVPKDFEKNWRMLICPVGRRNLVVASKGRTANYSKSGYRINTFPSNLPGGNKQSPSGYTLLDCIFCEVQKTFFVLDIMCWNKHPVYDCDTDFRFFWLQSKLEEIAGDEAIGPYKFEGIPTCKCSKTDMELMLETGLSKTTDGILFYFSKTCYLFGTTPLVLWLKPNMLPDMLGVRIPHIEGLDDVSLDQC